MEKSFGGKCISALNADSFNQNLKKTNPENISRNKSPLNSNLDKTIIGVHDNTFISKTSNLLASALQKTSGGSSENSLTSKNVSNPIENLDSKFQKQLKVQQTENQSSAKGHGSPILASRYN